VLRTAGSSEAMLGAHCRAGWRERSRPTTLGYGAGRSLGLSCSQITPPARE
jgi:hypothetical protein